MENNSGDPLLLTLILLNNWHAETKMLVMSQASVLIHWIWKTEVFWEGREGCIQEYELGLQ